MRQVFSSPRLENVERVAQLLRDAGIEVRINNGRSYKSHIRGDFSYRDQDSPRPSVWVIRSDQQAPARALLRDAGLIDTTRGENAYKLPSFRTEAPVAITDPARRRALIMKAGLLAVIVVVLGLGMVHTLNQPPRAQMQAQAAPPFDGSVAATLIPVARAVLASEIGNADTPVACLAVDGKDAPDALIGPLQAATRAVVPGSHCERVADEATGSYHRASNREATLVDVSGFRPSDPDSGTIELSLYHHRMWASYKTLEVKRVDGVWQVVRVVKHVRT